MEDEVDGLAMVSLLIYIDIKAVLIDSAACHGRVLKDARGISLFRK